MSSPVLTQTCRASQNDAVSITVCSSNFCFCFCQITITETVMFLVQYTSKEFDRSDQTVATGDCCYLNPMVRRTFRFLGEFGQSCSFV